MSTQIRQALSAQLRDELQIHIYEDKPDLAPLASDCPALILARREPFLSVSVPYNDVVRYAWHYDLVFLLRPVGLEGSPQWVDDLEQYPAQLIQALAAHLTVDQTAVTVRVESEFAVGRVAYNNVSYYGFQVPMDVLEDKVVTFAA